MKTLFALTLIILTASLSAQTTSHTQKTSKQTTETTTTTAAPATPTPPAEAKPGAVVIGNSTKNCTPGDNSPAGTVVDGYKKVVEATPFGNACRWIANP